MKTRDVTTDRRVTSLIKRIQLSMSFFMFHDVLHLFLIVGDCFARLRPARILDSFNCLVALETERNVILRYRTPHSCLLLRYDSEQ